jgi:hypothetical protein
MDAPTPPAGKRYFLADQTELWLAGEREASAQIAAGEFTTFATVEGMFGALNTSPVDPRC